MKSEVVILQLRPEDFAGFGKPMVLAPHELVARQTFRSERHEPKARSGADAVGTLHA